MSRIQAGPGGASPETSMDRLRWQCRRGLLELDLLFTHFLEHEYPSMSSEDQQTFRRLLDQPDPHLLAWLLGEETSQDQALNRLVNKMRQRAYAR